MGPEQWKGEVPPREAAEREEPAPEQRGVAREASDPREDEGYSQPESSAQKQPTRPDALKHPQGSGRDPSGR